jgi:predicted HicB family RNase H-like nuclease
MDKLPVLEYKGYKAILTLNPEDNRLFGKIYSPDNPLEPMDGWGFTRDSIKDAEIIFHYQVEKIILHKENREKCLEWKKNTDFESVGSVMNILPDKFRQRLVEHRFDNSLLLSVKGGDYEVPLYYVTKAWDVLLKGSLFPIDFMIGPEEDEDCTENDIKEFLAEKNATRTRCKACNDNDNMKAVWKEFFDIDIDSLEVDFLKYNMHIPPNFSYEEYFEYFKDIPDGIEEWILFGINYPESEEIAYDYVSALMEFTAQVLMWRNGEIL